MNEETDPAPFHVKHLKLNSNSVHLKYKLNDSIYTEEVFPISLSVSCMDRRQDDGGKVGSSMRMEITNQNQKVNKKIEQKVLSISF